MSITDELRKWGYGFCGDTHDVVTAIADRIDAEHKRECKEQYACGVEHGIGASIDASMIQTHGYVELPKDADGEYIRIGDMMECLLDGVKQVLRVGYMTYRSDGWHIALTIEDNFKYQSYTPKELRHYHAPTVEDVLEELLREYDRDDSELTNGEIVEMFAKRLTLAGDDE